MKTLGSAFIFCLCAYSTHAQVDSIRLILASPEYEAFCQAVRAVVNPDFAAVVMNDQSQGLYAYWSSLDSAAVVASKRELDQVLETIKPILGQYEAGTLSKEECSSKLEPIYEQTSLPKEVQLEQINMIVSFPPDLSQKLERFQFASLKLLETFPGLSEEAFDQLYSSCLEEYFEKE